MHKLSFDETMKGFDLIVSTMNDANKKNNTMFRTLCKEVFKKSYAKLESQKNLDTCGKMLGIGIASVIKMAGKQYEKGFFKKSVQKLNHQDGIPSYADMLLINSILEDTEFAFVVKLLKIQRKYGLIEAISSVSTRD